MSISALQEYTRVAKYARYLPEKKRRETWNEQVDRVFNMHGVQFENVMGKLKPYFEQAKSAVKKRIVLGSQRALQFGGQALLDQNPKMFNCSFSHINRVRAFQEAMYLLLCGCGVGFSVQRHHIAQLPDIAPRNGEERTFVIPDTIEGWADAIGVLMSSYFVKTSYEFKEWQGVKVKFDYSLIRPEGAIIKSSGHKAPGHKGLEQSINKIEALFERELNKGFTRLRPIDAYDIMMHSSDAVLSGGVRRSATICLFSPDDADMCSAKTGAWFYENPQRGRSNNSAVLLRDKTSVDQWNAVFESVRQFGEPGFIWTDDLEIGYNPCCEIGLDSIDKKGNHGFAFCNLTEINGRKMTSEEAFYEACTASAILGTMQASYTKMPYMFDGEVGYNVTEEIAKDEALLGCSITGVQDNPNILLNPEILRKGAELIKKVNEEVANIIGINTASRTTTIKPAGTTSLLLGSASGIHPHHAKRYFRRVQANVTETTLQFFEMFNSEAVQQSVWSNNGTDKVISFLCEVPEGARMKNDRPALKLLEDVKNVQQNWVVEGTRHERSKLKNITHNVSNTINVKDNEWDSVREYIYENRQWFAGISLLSMSGDLDYPQAPLQAVHTPTAIAKKYGDGSMMASGLIVDGLRVFNDNLWNACDVVVWKTTPLTDFPEDQQSWIQSTIDGLTPEQNDWVRRVVKFAKNYSEGNIRKTAYMLKEVHSWKVWCDLKRSYQDVPWDQMFEDRQESKNASDDVATACSGGACEISYNL